MKTGLQVYLLQTHPLKVGVGYLLHLKRKKRRREITQTAREKLA